MEYSTYIEFVDGASRHAQHSTSTAWVIYTPISQVLSSGGICLRPYRDSISHGILSLEVHIDSELVVSYLNGLYHVRDPTLLRRFLHVILLEW